MMSIMDCLFCKIITKQIPSEILYEDNFSMAFLDVSPCAPGHTVVLPKAHVETILKLSDGTVGPVFRTVKKITDALKSAFKPDGFTIGINHGPAAGQAIDHLHIHIIPRWRSDKGNSIHSIVTNIPKETLKEIRSKIMNYLPQ